MVDDPHGAVASVEAEHDEDEPIAAARAPRGAVDAGWLITARFEPRTATLQERPLRLQPEAPAAGARNLVGLGCRSAREVDADLVIQALPSARLRARAPG